MLSRTLLIALLFFSLSPIHADQTALVIDEQMKQVMSAYEEAIDLQQEFSEKGSKETLAKWFKYKLPKLSQAEYRRLGMNAYAESESDPTMFAVAALLLEHADSLLAQSWIQEKDAAKKIKIRNATRKEFETTVRFKAFAAFKAAEFHSQKEPDGPIFGPTSEFHFIASNSGVQRSNLALGYLLRRFRIENPDHKDNNQGLYAEERRYFSQAAQCDINADMEGIFVYEAPICEIAKTEYNVTDAAENDYLYSGPNELASVIKGMIGLAWLGNILEEQLGKMPHYESNVEPIRGATQLEATLWLNH